MMNEQAINTEVDIEPKYKKDVQYTAAEDYVLPSKGKIYDVPFNPNVRLRSMTVMEEMKRLSRQDGSNLTLCQIIDDCLLTELPISSYDMCMGDYEYLVHKLRVATYGPFYKMIVGCPHETNGIKCNSVITETFNLDELETKEFDVNSYFESLNLKLPICKKEIKLHMYTPRLEDTINRLVKEKELELEKVGANVGVDYTPLISLQCMIDTIDGEKYTYIQSKHFIEQMSAGDYNYIIQRVEKAKNMIGLNKQMNVICRKCGKAYKTYFRFSGEFFRPEVE